MATTPTRLNVMSYVPAKLHEEQRILKSVLHATNNPSTSRNLFVQLVDEPHTARSTNIEYSPGDGFWQESACDIFVGVFFACKTSTASSSAFGSEQSHESFSKAASRLSDVFANAAYEPDEAKIITRRAGFPSRYLPEFRAPLSFWSEVIQQMLNGRSSLLALVKEGIMHFPHNPELHQAEEIVRRMMGPSILTDSYAVDADSFEKLEFVQNLHRQLPKQRCSIIYLTALPLVPEVKLEGRWINLCETGLGLEAQGVSVGSFDGPEDFEYAFTRDLNFALSRHGKTWGDALKGDASPIRPGDDSEKVDFIAVLRKEFPHRAFSELCAAATQSETIERFVAIAQRSSGDEHRRFILQYPVQYEAFRRNLSRSTIP